jgi:hypothetical protein
MADTKGSTTSPPAPQKKPSRRWLKFGCLFFLLLLLVGLAGILWLLRGSLTRRFVTFPRYERELAAMKPQLQPPPSDAWKDLRCVVHSHSYLSHDSIGTPAEIVAAAKKVGIEAIFMTDHPTWDNKELTKALIGDISGVLFFPGYESGENMGIFPGSVTGELTHLVQLLPPEKKFDNIIKRGGLVIYAHPEAENRKWDISNFQGMEIYNIHTDFKVITDGKKGKLRDVLLDEMLMGKRFPMIAFREIFREPIPFLKRWDDLNQKRHVIGTAGNDAHQNVKFALRRTKDGKLGLYTGVHPEPAAAWGGLAGKIARKISNASGEIWSHQMDPYERSFAFVNTYLLVHEKTPATVFEALAQGRGYVAFGGFLDPRGFRFSYRAGATEAVMGSEVPWDQGATVSIRSPIKATLRIIRNGALLREEKADTLTVPVADPGVYRAEVHLTVAGEDWPWIYSNPIRVLSGPAASGG